jgi:TATA-box binding protein (TBP) (component of TFIID and TFIIIB)
MLFNFLYVIKFHNASKVIIIVDSKKIELKYPINNNSGYKALNINIKKMIHKKSAKNNTGSKTSNPRAYKIREEKPESDQSNKIDVSNDSSNMNEVLNIIKNGIMEKDNVHKKNKNTETMISLITKDNDDDNTTKDNENINNENVAINNQNITINEMAINTYSEAKKFLEDHNISISTITLDCKLHTLIDVDKFAKNVVLKEDEIVSVKFGNRKDAATNRTIVFIKTKKKPSKKNFYNQVTILMRPMNNPQRNYINIKVFKNGSLQMTGCKDMEDFNNVATTLIKILKRGCDIKTPRKRKVKHIDFIENVDEIGIFDVKIRMINSNFKLDYKVDRKKLARLLKKNHGQGSRDKEIGYVECKYEPTGGHSCVNIKYKYDDKNKPSIFVFQTGAIIITGAKNLPQIIMAYHFIHKILNKYYNEIRIIDLDQKAVQAEIAIFFKNKKKTELSVTDIC